MCRAPLKISLLSELPVEILQLQLQLQLRDSHKRVLELFSLLQRVDYNNIFSPVRSVPVRVLTIPVWLHH